MATSSTCPAQICLVLLFAGSTSCSQPSAGGRLQTVSSVAELSVALDDTTISHIVLNPGMYALGTQLSISRDVTLEAAQPGTVVLDGQGSTRVLYISSGTVGLIGLNTARGYSSYVSLPSLFGPSLAKIPAIT